MFENLNDYRKLDKLRKLILIQHDGVERGYFGQLKGNVPHGFGTLFQLPNIWDENVEPYILYKGHFKEGYFDGWGIEYYEGNPSCAGEFIKGKLNSYAKHLSNAPRITSGFYLNGQLCFSEENDELKLYLNSDDNNDEIDTPDQNIITPIPPKDGAGIR